MPLIHLTTFIAAPPQRVFDLSRSIDLHKKAMAHTKEEAVAGTTTGLIGLNETVTWKAKHLAKQRILKVKISQLQPYNSFTDEMVSGDFKTMKHEHYFKPTDNGTLMIDLLSFESPYGGLGSMFNKLYLTRYLQKLLEQRNTVIKQYAETEKWKQLLR
ncbi:MAG: cell division protein [Sphingobacteriales bacterium]|jgi:ligand-binding SRPBCC domain-containing protein|nr:MAG: cell division protein [Sphingobacteriales bacterium]